MYNRCGKCSVAGSSPAFRGSGRMAQPGRRWWQFWKTIACDACGGDGIAKPPGWPDPKEMMRLRPSPPSGSAGTMPPQAPTPPPEHGSTSYIQDVEPSLHAVTENARELLRELKAAVEERDALKQEVADLRSGKAFVGERYPEDETLVGGEYYWQRHVDGTLHLVIDDIEEPADGRNQYRYTGPITASLPEARLQETEKSTAGFAEAGEELQSGEPEDTTPLPEPEWEPLTDDDDNTYWEAESPWTADGLAIKWRLRQVVRDNRVQWIEDHDGELQSAGPLSYWDSLEEAHATIADDHRTIIDNQNS